MNNYKWIWQVGPLVIRSKSAYPALRFYWKGHWKVSVSYYGIDWKYRHQKHRIFRFVSGWRYVIAARREGE